MNILILIKIDYLSTFLKNKKQDIPDFVCFRNIMNINFDMFLFTSIVTNQNLIFISGYLV